MDEPLEAHRRSGGFDAGLDDHEGRILSMPGNRRPAVLMMDPHELLEAWERAALEPLGDGRARRLAVDIPLLVDVQPGEC